MSFITKNKKTIIISAAVLAVIILATVVGILIGKPSGDKPKSALEKIAETTSEFDADKYVCNIEYSASGITLKGEYVLTVSESDGGKSAELSYRYDKLSAIGESDEFISEVSGTLYARGEDEVGQLKESAIVWESGVVPSDISPLEISEDMFESFTANDEDGLLSLEGTLKKDLLGKGIRDAKLTASCSEKDTKVISLTLEYTDEYGARVRAVYNYSCQEGK